MLDFILDRKNIETINKMENPKLLQNKTKTISRDLNLTLFLRNVLLFCNKANKLTALKQLLVFFLCLMKKFVSFRNGDPKY